MGLTETTPTAPIWGPALCAGPGLRSLQVLMGSPRSVPFYSCENWGTERFSSVSGNVSSFPKNCLLTPFLRSWGHFKGSISFSHKSLGAEPFPYSSIWINSKNCYLLTHMCKVYILQRMMTEETKCNMSVKWNGIWQWRKIELCFMQQHRWTLKMLFWVRGARYKRSCIVWFHLCGKSGKSKSTETDRRLVVARVGRRRDGAWLVTCARLLLWCWKCSRITLWWWLCKACKYSKCKRSVNKAL